MENLEEDQRPWWLPYLPPDGADVTIAAIPEAGSRVRLALRLFRLYAGLGRHDAVVTQQDGFATFLVAFLNRLRGGKPYVHLVHEFITRERTDDPYSRLKYAFLRFCLASADAIQCSSRAEIDYYAQALGLDRARFRFVPLSTSPSFLEVPADADDGFIFSAGRTGRDYETLVRAAEGFPSEFRLVVGRDALRGRALPPNVTVQREIPLAEMIGLMARSACVALPLQDRRISVGQSVLLQAMALGKPIVTTRTGAVTDYVEDGRTALLVPPSDPAAMREALVRLAAVPEEGRRMGRAAREEIVGRFLPGPNLRLTCATLRELVGGRA